MTEQHLLDVFPPQETADPLKPLPLRGGQSKLLSATLDPTDLRVLRVNPALAQLCDLPEQGEDLSQQLIHLFDLCPKTAMPDLQALRQRYVLPLILRDVMAITPQDWRLWDQPQILTLASPHYREPRHIQSWFRWEQLQAERIDPNYDELAHLDLQEPAHLSQGALEARIAWDNYRISGELLWEGIDITPQETLRRLTYTLMDLGPRILASEHLGALGAGVRSLFQAETLLIFTLKGEQGQRLCLHNGESPSLPALALKDLEDSPVVRALQAKRVWNVPDLAADAPTVFETDLLAQGCRSLLLIPIHGGGDKISSGLGVVVLGGLHPHQYDQLDAFYAEQLIPPLRLALQPLPQTKLARVHPAVEWRFLQEAERRAAGLPPERIVLRNLYPMYGMSDIRGSSQERNRAIQADLLAQFNLAMGVIDRVAAEQDVAFLAQLRLDLETYRDRLSTDIQAEDEVTAFDYLDTEVHPYFDYFAQVSAGARQAIALYRQACDNPHHCIYTARDRYDQAVQSITQTLRNCWDHWQTRMQGILPHYCDTEVSDGIDHMLYVGSDIDPRFSPFHLHSLRYEQLRALCACARTCLEPDPDLEIPLFVTHLLLIQNITVDIFHDETTERVFDVMGTRDTRYEIVKKRIDKALDGASGDGCAVAERITQPGMLTLVYSTESEWREYRHYVRYLQRESWVSTEVVMGEVEPLQGITGLKFARLTVLPQNR